jgi:hypothetical protein
MLDQSFSIQNFRRLLSFKDFTKYEFREVEEEINSILVEVVAKINASTYSFSTLTQIVDNDNLIYSPAKIEDELALRKLNDNLKRLYKFKQANRFLIIGQIKSLLLEDIPMSVIKLDIQKFYEEIKKEKICKKLLDDPLLSFHSKQILKKFFNLPETLALTGLPRGINISAALSEIMMRDFDKKIAQLPGVYFYARYVDDIIIFTFKNPKDIATKASEILDYETGLKLNHKKTKIIQRQCRCKPVCICVGICKCFSKCRCLYNPASELFFEYLGYRFIFPDIAGYSQKLVITLAKKKVKKIKTRIILSFLDFIKNKDFNLLERRIAFLSSNFIVRTSKYSQSLNAGIFFNYPHINETGQTELDEMTAFLRKTINSKSKSFGIKLSAHLTPINRSSLSKYCFKAGFLNRKVIKYAPTQIKQIKKCWIHE